MQHPQRREPRHRRERRRQQRPGQEQLIRIRAGLVRLPVRREQRPDDDSRERQRHLPREGVRRARARVRGGHHQRLERSELGEARQPVPVPRDEEDEPRERARGAEGERRPRSEPPPRLRVGSPQRQRDRARVRCVVQHSGVSKRVEPLRRRGHCKGFTAHGRCQFQPHARGSARRTTCRRLPAQATALVWANRCAERSVEPARASPSHAAAPRRKRTRARRVDAAPKKADVFKSSAVAPAAGFIQWAWSASTWPLCAYPPC